MLCLLLFCSLKVYANTCHWQPNCSYRRYFCDFNWTSPETLYIINLFESSLYPPEIVYRLRRQIIKRVLGCRTFSVSHQNNSIWPKWNRTLIIGFACSPQTHLSQSEGLLNKKPKGLLLSSKLTQGILNSKSQQSSHVCWYSFFFAVWVTVLLGIRHTISSFNSCGSQRTNASHSLRPTRAISTMVQVGSASCLQTSVFFSQQRLLASTNTTDVTDRHVTGGAQYSFTLALFVQRPQLSKLVT